MNRIEELQKKYPTVHKDIIVKWEINTEGTRDSKDLDLVSYWKPRARGVYQSYDEGLTLERIKKETPWRITETAVLRPNSLWMKTGLSFWLYRKDRSPYVIREIGNGKVGLFEGDERIDVDLFAPPQKRTRLTELKTRKGTPVQDLVEVRGGGNCYVVMPTRFCEYFNAGEECKFCNFNPTQADSRSVGISRPVSINADETAEAFKIIGSETRLVEGMLVGGGIKSNEKEASINVRFAEKLHSSLPYRTHLELSAEAMPRRELQRLKDAGLDGVRFHMEVFDERMFERVNPGKAKHLSREGWLEAFQEAVDIFGVGKVGAKFVGGATLLGPDAYSTWQEARDVHIEGERWLIKNGIFPATQALRWAPGSPFSKDPANRDKFPPTEFYLDIAVANHEACAEYGLYEKLDRLLYCGLCYIELSYIGDIGMLEIAGDVGTWMGAVVPPEQNWLAQFISSVRSPAGA